MNIKEPAIPAIQYKALVNRCYLYILRLRREYMASTVKEWNRRACGPHIVEIDMGPEGLVDDSLVAGTVADAFCEQCMGQTMDALKERLLISYKKTLTMCGIAGGASVRDAAVDVEAASRSMPMVVEHNVEVCTMAFVTYGPYLLAMMAALVCNPPDASETDDTNALMRSMSSSIPSELMERYLDIFEAQSWFCICHELDRSGVGMTDAFEQIVAECGDVARKAIEWKYGIAA
jgi:hypothetical protein